ncbi:hypothetical protein DRO61_05265 [Candidatus Bathyarchaeota archaeon]|nr:MAG: hypothetical protein DRO61_05265 [Candidatus Bathyarchaeota archaeon]
MALPTNLAFVTVMDVTVYSAEDLGGSNLGTIECLTISNIIQEGPRKEARAGKDAQPCIRYGKTMRLEMEDVILRTEMLEAFFGATVVAGVSVAFTDEFATPISLTGDAYVVNKDTGARDEVTITFNSFLPDSVMDITMESEGDIGMISIAGELFPDANGAYFTITET